MSVNRGFFFSNPTSFPAENEDERSIDVSGIAASNDGSISGAAMPYNFNTNFNCGSYQPLSSMSVNNLNAGNAVMNYNSNNVNGDINLGNNANNMGINANVGFPTNNNFYGNQNNMANNASYNNMGAHNVQNVQNFNAGFVQDVRNTQNTKFGGFFFNPLSIFTNNNSNATVFNNNDFGLINTSAITNNNTLGENNALTSNTIYTNAVMNSNPLGVYQQTPPVQMNFKSVSTSPAFQNDQYATSDSPIPMAFLTPNQGPTPCPTPPAVLKSPMFLDAYSYPPPSDVSVNQNSNNSNDWNQVEATQETNNTHTQETIAPSKGLFRRGISTVGSALGTVATYVNQSFLSGIPFHIADRALKESKETYAKWWEDGINAHKGKKRMGGTNSGDSSGDNDEDDNAERDGSDRQLGKKRKLDSSEAAGVCGTGSALSISLEKNYNDLGIDTSSKFFGYPQQQQHQNQFISSSQSTKVDSSIIKSRRRSQFEHKRASHASSVKQEEPVFPDDWSSGYNVFNNIGGMYDFGEENDGGVESENGCTEGDIGEYSTYDSLGDYYTTNEHDDQDNEVSTAHALSKSNAATITSTLDGTMQIIAELLEEKNRASEENEMLQMVSNPRNWVKKSIRSELIDALQSAHGDVKDKRFLSALEILSNFYKTSGRDARVSPWSGRRVSDPGFDGGEYGYSGNEIGGPTSSDLFEGYWLNMSRPNYVECLGTNMESEFMYTLGRMSFDMFQPSNLICSVQSTHNTIKIIGEREELPAFVPKSLKEEVASLCDSGGDGSANRPLLRSYDIAVSLTIEPPSSVGQPEPPNTQTPTKRMRALMSVTGYVLPDPDTPNRLTVWFTGGKLSPARLSSLDRAETDDEDEEEYNEAPIQNDDGSDGYGGFEDWTAMFAKGKWRKTLGERARALAAKLLLGADVPNKMEEDGHMEYALHRPIGGHGKIYVDVLYLDEDILIMRGHRGTIYPLARSGVSQRYRTMRGNLSANINE